MNRASGWKWIAPVAIGAVLTWGPPLADTAAAADSPCDRACLHRVLDGYLAAVFKHDPKAAPLAAQARATENATTLADGTGIWLTASGYGSVQRRYFDTAEGQAAYYGIINEGSEPAIVSVRLKIVRQRVTEAEWTVARKTAGGLFSIEGLTGQPPPPDEPIPVGERVPRAALIAAADTYFNGLQIHDGSAVPHIQGCDRIENGIKVTNRLRSSPLTPVPGGAPAPAATPGVPGLAQETPAAGAAGAAPGLAQEARSGDCAAGFDMFAHSIAEASHRRYPLVDVEAGVVMGATIFHRPPESSLKRNLLTEYFWEKQGKISAIYAAMYYLDPAAPDSSGWN
jgi:hypothetical protein